MSGFTEERFKDYQERMKTFPEKYNVDKEAAFKHVTGYGADHCAWRYVKIHGAVEMMGGWANCSYWIQNHANNYFMTCEKLVKLLEKVGRHLPKEQREGFKAELLQILKDEP